MTAVIHHGPPGSYKTFAIVQRVIIPALEAGRTVCHNIRGLTSVDRIGEVMGLSFPESAKLIAVEHDSDEGFQHMGRFFSWAPMGALIVMDEAQEVYPTRLRKLDIYDTHESQREISETGFPRPYTVEKAFDKHRHMNWDIYLSTPNISKIHSEIRGIVEYAYRHRDMSGVLPWYKNQWREFKHEAESTGKQFSHYIGTPIVHKADPRVFECYQSTATGVAKSSNEDKSIFSDSRVRIYIGLALVSGVIFFTNIGQIADHFLNPGKISHQNSDSTSDLSLDVSASRASPSARIETPVHVTSAVTPRDYSVYPEHPDAYFRMHNQMFRPETLYDYPQSSEWRLTGVVIARAGSVALISDGHHTRTLSLDRSCMRETATREWVCLVAGELVGQFTGNIEDDQPEQEPLPLAQTINENSLMPLNM
jgi:zona occludens toxin